MLWDPFLYCINDSIQGNSETGNKVFTLPSEVSINTIPELKEFVYHNTFQISSIIDLFEYCKDFHLDIPKCAKNMICEACACNGCEFMRDHLGYTCEDCKKDYYTGYQGYCDE